MTDTPINPLRQRMIEDMKARKLTTGTQTGHIRSCRRFAGFLKRSPETASADDIRLFQLHLAETAMSISNRNRTMTGLRFLFRVTLRRPDLATEIYHVREPQKIPLVMSPDETRRLLAVAGSLKARVALSLGYGCGLRAGEVVNLKAKHIPRVKPEGRLAPSGSSASSRPRAARTAMSCCRPRRSICCANGGERGQRATMGKRPCRSAGCFRDARRAGR